MVVVNSSPADEDTKNGLDPSQVLQEAEVLKFLSAETSTVWRGAEKVSNGLGLGKTVPPCPFRLWN